MKRLIVLLILSVLISCKGDDDTNQINVNNNQNNEQTNITLVTGVDLRTDINTQPIVYGNPNNKNNGVFVTPNPSIGTFKVSSFNAGNINQIWILPANPKKIHQDVNFGEVLADVSYNDTELTAASTQTVSDINGSSVIVNIENLESGYYRVFIKINGSLRWDNIYINNGGNVSIEDIASFWK